MTFLEVQMPNNKYEQEFLRALGYEVEEEEKKPSFNDLLGFGDKKEEPKEEPKEDPKLKPRVEFMPPDPVVKDPVVKDSSLWDVPIDPTLGDWTSPDQRKLNADIMHQYETGARTQNIERFTGAIKQVPRALARGTGQLIAGVGGGLQRTAAEARAPELWAEAEEAEPVEMGSPRYFQKSKDISRSTDPLQMLARIIGKDRVASFGDWNVKVGESIQKSYPPSGIAKRPATDPKTFLNPEALLHPQWWAENTVEMVPMVVGLIGAVLATRGLTTRLGSPKISEVTVKRMAESGSAAMKKLAADLAKNPELTAGWERIIEVFVPAWFNAQLEAGFAFVEAKGAGQDDLLASQNAHKVFTHNLPWTAMFSTSPLAALRKYPGAFTRMFTAVGEPIQEVGEEIISSWFVHGEMPSTEHMVKTFVTMAPIGAASAAFGERQPSAIDRSFEKAFEILDRAMYKAEGDILEVENVKPIDEEGANKIIKEVEEEKEAKKLEEEEEDGEKEDEEDVEDDGDVDDTGRGQKEADDTGDTDGDPDDSAGETGDPDPTDVTGPRKWRGC